MVTIGEGGHLIGQGIRVWVFLKQIIVFLVSNFHLYTYFHKEMLLFIYIQC